MWLDANSSTSAKMTAVSFIRFVSGRRPGSPRFVGSGSKPSQPNAPTAAPGRTEHDGEARLPAPLSHTGRVPGRADSIPTLQGPGSAVLIPFSSPPPPAAPPLRPGSARLDRRPPAATRSGAGGRRTGRNGRSAAGPGAPSPGWRPSSRSTRFGLRMRLCRIALPAISAAARLIPTSSTSSPSRIAVQVSPWRTQGP